MESVVSIIDGMLLRGGVMVGRQGYYTNLCAHLALLQMVLERLEYAHD